MGLRKKSAQKKHRQSLKRRERNRFVTSTLKTKIKNYSKALEGDDLGKSQALLKELVSLVDKAATKGVIHRKKASRYVSKFSKKLSDLGGSPQAQAPASQPES